MKKDKFIQKKLNEYADSIKPPYHIIADAVAVVKNNAPYRKQSRTQNRFIKVFGAVATAAAVFVCVVYMFTHQNIGGGDTYDYHLTALGRNIIELNEIKDIDENILVIEEENMSAECYAFFDRESGDTVTVSAKYKIIGENGIEEVYIIADLERGLTGYENFKDYYKQQINGTVIRLYEYYIDGEYYTNAYFNINDIDYYVIVMSNKDGRGYYYIEELF